MKFDRKEYGSIKGFIIKADMIHYGTRQKVPDGLFGTDEVEITKVVYNSTSRNYTLANVVPWSRYKITLYVLNSDDLKANATSAVIEMPEGGKALMKPNYIIIILFLMLNSCSK